MQIRTLDLQQQEIVQGQDGEHYSCKTTRQIWEANHQGVLGYGIAITDAANRALDYYRYLKETQS